MLTEHRHYSDELYLSLQRQEEAYNVPVLQWDSTTATLLTGIDDASVHERWDDVVLGADALRLGSRLAAAQARASHSLTLPVTVPRVTLHTLAGLVGLTLGQVVTVPHPLQTSFRHRLTLAPPTQLPSISAKIGHLQSLYTLYGGLKGDSFTLHNNDAYLHLTTQLIGAGSRVGSTASPTRTLTLVTTGTPPEAHRITDAAAGVWYVSPDGTGSLLIDVVPPVGVSLDVGTGLTLRSVPGPRYRLGIGTDGTLEVPVVSTEPAGVLEVAALRDPSGLTWYVWMDGDTLTLDTTLPLAAPPALVEPWLRWGTGRLWLADVTDTPAPLPLLLTQGMPNIGPAALEISSRVVGLTVAGENHLLAGDAYRLQTGAVRSNFHAARQAVTVTLQLEVDPATEAADLAAYLDQRVLAFEWQCVDVPTQVDFVATRVVTIGTPPAWHQVTDSGGGTWYLGVDVLGELTVSTTLPAGSGLVVGLGLELLARDGWRYRLGVDGLGGYTVTQTTFVGSTPPTEEVCALLDPSGSPWGVGPDGRGGVVVQADPVSTVLVTPGTPPAWQLITDSGGGLWYLGVTVGGELTVSDTHPGGSGIAVNTGLELLARDGWRYRLGVDGLGGYTVTQTTFVNPPTPTEEVCALLDPSGLPWYVGMDGLGGVVVWNDRPEILPWRSGFAWVCPRLQWRALVRGTQAQMDILELTGTVEEILPDEPVILDIWNTQPGYLQRA